jgi:hypothetical protein
MLYGQLKRIKVRLSLFALFFTGNITNERDQILLELHRDTSNGNAGNMILE